MLRAQLVSTFNKLFNKQPTTLFFSPGRVNLIGEHIDYNGGLVVPFAIEKGIYAAVTPRSDQSFHVYSYNFLDLPIQIITLDQLSTPTSHLWANYVKGILLQLLQKDYRIPFGLNIVLSSNLPNSSGLSSSACLVSASIQNGALSERMTGAGFGGCAICLVKEKHASYLILKVDAIYEKTIGYKATFLKTIACDGPMQLS